MGQNWGGGLFLSREKGGLSLKDLAGYFELDESSVSRTAVRVARQKEDDSEWNKVLRRLEKRFIPRS